jgi:hypothetical protein
MSDTQKSRQQRDEERRREALRDLERVGEQGEVLGTSQMRRSAERARDHFLGADADREDPIEVWGRRIGRILSLAFLLFLVFYLARTYL